MQRKEWQTPALTVLVRSKPEEAVLNVCKGSANGPADNFGNLCLGNCGANPACNVQGVS